MASKIASMAGFSKVIYNRAGDPYYGAMEDTANLKGIPAVACEFLTPHGTLASGSVEKLLQFMNAFLKYNGLI